MKILVDWDEFLDIERGRTKFDARNFQGKEEGGEGWRLESGGWEREKDGDGSRGRMFVWFDMNLWIWEKGELEEEE